MKKSNAAETVTPTTKSNILVKNIELSTTKYDFSVPEFTPEEMEKVKKMLPPPSRKVAFQLLGCSVAVANALRRTAISEVQTKALAYDPLSLDTNEEYILPYYLHDRITFIPLAQDCPLDAVFSVDVANTSESDEFRVRSASMHSVGKALSVFSPQFCIADLHQSKFLKIPRISVEVGFGWQHARWSLTKNITYSTLDYIDVAFLNEQGNIHNRRVRTSELNALIKKLGIKVPPGQKPLIIPNTAAEAIRPIPAKYVVVEEDLPSYSSTEVTPREFELSFTFHNVEPLIGMRMICDSIIGRLQGILDEFNKPEPANIRITRKDTLTNFYIAGETYTIGNLLVHAICTLDPQISLANVQQEHALNRSIIINLRHTEPLRIIADALRKNIDDFRGIRKYFE